LLPVEQLERIQGALSASLPGECQATTEARVHAEMRHAERVRVISRLLRGGALTRGNMPEGHEELFDELAQEPFLATRAESLVIVDPSTLLGNEIARFFECLFQAVVPVGLLGFIADDLHRPYVERLIDALSELQPGLTLDDAGYAELREIAPYFPSVWLEIARPDAS
jgi:hypothetical protein